MQNDHRKKGNLKNAPAGLFGIKAPQNIKLFWWIIIATGCALVAVAIWFWQTNILCIDPRASDCGVPPLQGSSGLEIFLACVALFFSAVIGLSQKEQSEFLHNSVTARQFFEPTDRFHVQLSRLSSALAYDRQAALTEESLALYIYISTPAFGIMAENLYGLDRYSALIDEFIDIAQARAKSKRTSKICFYVWDEDTHKTQFTEEGMNLNLTIIDPRTKEVKKSFKNIIQRYCQLLKISEESANDDDPNRNKLINIEIYSITKSEARFFVLDIGETQRHAAMLVMPKTLSTNSDLSSILIYDTTSQGTKKIRDFFLEFSKAGGDSSPKLVDKNITEFVKSCFDKNVYDKLMQ